MHLRYPTPVRKRSKVLNPSIKKAAEGMLPGCISSQTLHPCILSKERQNIYVRTANKYIKTIILICAFGFGIEFGIRNQGQSSSINCKLNSTWWALETLATKQRRQYSKPRASLECNSKTNIYVVHYIQTKFPKPLKRFETAAGQLFKKYQCSTSFILVTLHSCYGYSRHFSNFGQ